MDDTGIVRFPGHLDPRAQEFRPRNPSPHNQITLLQPQIYYPYPPSYSSSGVQLMPFYDRGVGYQHVPSSSSPAYYRPTSGGVQQPLPPPSAAATRSLLLSSVPTEVNEEIVRRELEVFGEVRAVEMERVQDGIVIVHFYDLRHAQAAMIEIQEQHMQQQSRLRHLYNSLTFMPSWGLEVENSAPLPVPLPCRGLIAGRAVWAQFTLPAVIAGTPDGPNQGTLVIFNLDSGVSASRLKEIFETFGPIKELRETPSKRHQRFVEFNDIRDAARALSEMDGKEINGQSVIIEFSRPGGNRRRLSNATITSLNKNMNSSNSFYSTRITNYPPPPPPPLPSLKPFGNSTSNISPSNPSPHFQQTLKNPRSGRGLLNTWNNNPRSNYGAGAAPLEVPMASLSLAVARNGCESEGMSFSGTSSKRGAKIRDSTTTDNNCQSTTKQQQGKQPKSSRSWKGRQKNSDSHFLINEDAMVESSSIRDTRTTVMIKNIPNKYSQKLLLNMLDNHCIHCNEQINSDGDDQPLSAYDFVYLPIDFNNKCNVGYGFVNLTSPQATWRLYKAFHLQQWEVFNSRKICEVTYARLQGLEALKDHFKNSKFACETDEYLPVVFSPPRDGKQLTEPMAIGGHGSAAAVFRKQIMLRGGGGMCSIGGPAEVIQVDGQDDKLEGHDHVDENNDEVEDGGGGSTDSCKNDCEGNHDGRSKTSRNKEVVVGKKKSSSSSSVSSTVSSTTTTGNCGSSSSNVVAAPPNGCLSSSGPKQQPKILSCAQVK